MPSKQSLGYFYVQRLHVAVQDKEQMHFVWLFPKMEHQYVFDHLMITTVFEEKTKTSAYAFDTFLDT
jgi:hypothetical protein